MTRLRLTGLQWGSLTRTTPYSEDDIRSVLDHVQSYDELVRVVQFAQSRNVGLSLALTEVRKQRQADEPQRIGDAYLVAIRVGDQTRDYCVVLMPDPDGGFTADVPELKGCVTEGETVEEALANAKEAIVLHQEPL